MTTPANNGPHGGANKPEDDDPFGYLYADGQAAGAAPPTSGGGYGYPGASAGGPPGAQPGVPRTSHHQVRTVGERTYGGQRGPVPHQQSPAQQPPGYQAQYQAPEALQAGGYGVPQQSQAPQSQTQAISRSGGHGGGSGASSRRGLLIAAVAVVGAVAVGIGLALAYGGKDKDKNDNNTANGGQQSAAPQNPASQAPSSPKPSQAPLPKGEAAGAGMSITGGAALESTVPGAKSSGGQYVGRFNQTGAAVTWTLDVPKAGKYKFFVRFGIPGEDANGTLTVNGKANESPISMRNFAKSPKGDWEKGWQTTWGRVDLDKGANTIKLSCEAGNSCNANIDQLWLEEF